MRKYGPGGWSVLRDSVHGEGWSEDRLLAIHDNLVSRVIVFEEIIFLAKIEDMFLRLSNLMIVSGDYIHGDFIVDLFAVLYLMPFQMVQQ